MVDDLGVWPKVVGHSHARTVTSRVKRSCASNPERVPQNHCPQTSCVGWEHLLLVAEPVNPGIIGHSGATTCLQPSGTASSGGAADAYTGKADSYVPTFNGKQSDYREYRRRCDIYQMKMKLANREKETVFNLVTLLQGRAWDCVEDLTVEDLAKPEALCNSLRAPGRCLQVRRHDRAPIRL